MSSYDDPQGDFDYFNLSYELFNLFYQLFSESILSNHKDKQKLLLHLEG